MLPQRILVPVDYSEHAERVVAFASELAARLGASLELLHVWETMPNAPPTMKVMTEGGLRPICDVLRDDAERDMQEFLAKLHFGDVPHTHALDSGDPVRAIVRRVEQQGHQLIVMGTHGRTGLGHLVLGSVAERVLRTAKVPVLTVPLRAG